MTFFYKIKKLLLTPIIGICLFILEVTIIPIVISQEISILGNNFLNFFLIFMFNLIILEIFFLTTYKLIKGYKYVTPSIIKFEDLHIEPHPYIPYIFKKNAKSPPSELTRFSLHRGKYYSCDLKTNNLRFYNGIEGDRDVLTPKPNGLLRVNCIGESTTQYYVSYNNKNYSYPLELEKILQNKINKKIEVNNCAQGGYNTADLLVRFCLQIIDTNPDVVIIYHGQTDVRSYITPNFENDYSHSRRNLSEFYRTLERNSKIPNLPLKFFNYLKNYWFPYNTRSSLLDLIHKSKEDEKVNYTPGLKVYRRNLQHIIDICLARNIKVVLGTYCHFLYENVKNSSIHRLYNEIIKEENTVIRDLAKTNNLDLVDNDSLIPREEKYFLDSVHFTPEGMKLLAKNFSEVLINKI